MSFWKLALNNVKRNTKTYLGYFISCVVFVLILFSFFIFIFHPNLLDPKYDSLRKGMIYAEIVIGTFSLMFVCYSLNMIFKIRSKNIGILMILGMTKRQLNYLLLLINLILGFFSIATGIIIGHVFTRFFLLLSKKIMGINILSFYIPIKASICTIITSFSLFLIISLVIPFFLRIMKIDILLKEANKGDKEIKFSRTLSILSVFIIISGYFMAIFRELEVINDFLFGVTDIILIQNLFIFIIITIGTYLFFSQFSFFVVQKLKMKRSFYMKKINILWISDFSFRIRYNARVLFVVTILLTITFISITFFSVMNAKVKEITMKEYSVPFSYLSLPENEKEQEHIKEIEDSLNEQGFQFEKNKSTILKQITDNKQEIHIISLSDFHEIIGFLNLKKISLEEYDALLVPVSWNYDIKRDSFLNSKTLALNHGNIVFEDLGIYKRNILPIYLDFKILVVDNHIYKVIEKSSEKKIYYAYKVLEWEKTANIAQHLYETFNRQSEEFHFFAASRELATSKEFYMISLNLSLFIGVMFLSVSGNFLYLRFYTILNQEKKKYRNISKIGLTVEEMKKASSIQMGIIYFSPFIIASFHTFFFIKTLEIIFSQSFISNMFIVLLVFFVVQFIQFVIIRSRYIRDLSRAIV